MRHLSHSRRHILRYLTATFLTAVLLVTLVPFKRTALASKPTNRAVLESTARTAPVAANTSDDKFAETSAMPSEGGVRVQWRVTSDADTRGYYVYRIQSRRVTLATRISSSESSTNRNSYQWLDPDGSSDSIYYIESIPLNKTSKIHDAVVVTAAKNLSSSERRAQLRNSDSVAEDQGFAKAVVTESPATLSPQSVEAAINDQWAIAAQTALKIQIKSDGWYRVTQQQMSTAGFNPTVDIRNLSLFGDGRELAIRTSKDTGQLTTGDYIEFYGRGLDTPDTDARVYFLIAGTLPGKRTANEAVGDNTQRTSPSQAPGPEFTYRGMFLPLLNLFGSANTSEVSRGEAKPIAKSQEVQSTEFHPLSSPIQLLPRSESPVDIAKRPPDLNTTTAPAPETSKAVPATEAPPISKAKGKGKSKAKNRSRVAKSRSRMNRSKPRHNHASSLAATSVPSFNDTLQIKERFNYNPQLPVGQNFFGATMGTTFPLTQKLTVRNIESGAESPALLEIALQGISITTHQVNVRVNGVLIGTMNFFGHGRPVQTFSVPVSQFVEGDNTIRFEPQLSNEFIGVDHIKLTYPHSYTANGNTLRFSARSTQTVKVDGFSVSNVLLLDISDPFNVELTHPAFEVSGAGFAITVPPGPHKKGRGPRFGIPELQPVRTMHALPDGQPQQPAGLSLNQPSALNQSTNRADLLIISAKDFLPGIAPLVAQRQAQGLLVQVVDVEDVYDEFSFGAHSSQAVQDFLLHAASHWATAPRYVLLAGDATYDPRDHSSAAMVRANKGCTDTNNNAADFSSILFGNAHTSAFGLTPPCSSPSGVTISQIYTGIGEPGGSYTNSYIELFNGGSAPVNLNGWSVQYASGAGTTWQVTNLTNLTVQPNHYYLVKEASSGGTYPLPTADATGNISMSTRAGKIALVNSTTPLVGACPTGGSIVDFVGYGSAANCFEGSGPAAIANDFVPTKQVDTTFGVACSDDSLADFNNDGVPEIAVGRLPGRTPAEFNLIVSKIVGFSKANVPQSALFVADTQGNYYWNFESHSDDLANLVTLSPKQKIYLASQPSPAACEANIINAINQGVALVNYQGHGNVDVWSGSSIFTNRDAYALTNGNRLPLVVVADCLNGLFDDPVLEGLAETLLKAPNGGAVAAYASSGETIPDGQQDMSARVYQLLFGPQSMALGDVTKQAKTSTTDLDVRRTWILLGDPSMKIW